MNRVPPHASAHPRQGAALLVAVVLLGVTIALLAAAARTAALAARATGPAEAGVRAGLLADAAATLARRRLAADPAAAGFEWAPRTPAGPAAATVTLGPAPGGTVRATVAAAVGAGDDAAGARRAFLVVVPPDVRPSDVPEPPRRPLVAPRPGAAR